MSEPLGYFITHEQLLRIDKALRGASTWINAKDRTPPNVVRDINEGLRTVDDIRGRTG